MIDIGIITGSGIYELPGDSETRVVGTRFGEVEVAVSDLGPWTVGSISRHQSGHRHLPHTIPHQAHIMALKRLGARAVLATTAVGALDPNVKLGNPILFDDLFFLENRLPDGAACTVFTEPADPARSHLIQSEPFAPRLRRRMEQTADVLGLEVAIGGTYAHVNGPRFNTSAEIRWLSAAGVGVVSQTCGPEPVLAGELELPYGLVGFPVNYASGGGEAGDGTETQDELSRLLALSAQILPRLVLRTSEMLQEADFVFDYGYVYRVEGGIAQA